MCKKILSLFMVMVLLLSLTSCKDLVGGAFMLLFAATSDDSAEKEDIISFVEKHQDELLECVESNDYSSLEKYSIIKSVSADETAVDFYCGGAGFGSATFYCGFYYTAENDMSAIYRPSKDKLQACGEGFEWTEDGGDNRYYTEKICDRFYYYETSY